MSSCIWPGKKPAPPPVQAEKIDTRRWAAGVPLGGIGAGKIELLTDGSIGNLTINNNHARPIAAPRACFAALRVQAGELQIARMLRLHTDSEYGNVANAPRTLYSGAWPRAEIDFLDPALPADVHIETFSPIVPGDAKDSSLPVTVFRFIITNRHDGEIDTTVVMSWENVLGIGAGDPAWDTVDGNDQREQRIAGLRGVSFTTGQRYAGKRANAVGEYFIGTRDDGATITVRRSWNAVGQNIPFWRHLTQTGKLDPSPLDVPAGSDGHYHPAAAIASRVRIPKGEMREFLFVLAWFTPSFFTDQATDHGHYYTNHFDSAPAVAAYTAENLARLYKRTIEWHGIIRDSNLPRWFQNRLIDGASIMSSTTLLTKDRQFAFISDPTGVGRAAGPWAADSARAVTMMFYPGLERSRLELIARSQQKNGAVPGHCGSTGEGFGRDFAGSPTMEDTCAFILQVLHYYRWSGDRAFFERMQPNILAAMNWLDQLDPDGDGIPGPGATTAAAATTYLATLLAGEDIAYRLSDRSAGAEYRAQFEKARNVVARQLWNGFFYDKSFDAAASRREDLCGTDMLTGEWFSQQIGLGRAIPEPMTDSALRSMLKLNAAWSPKLPPEDVNVILSRQSRMASLPEIEARLATMLIRHGYTDDAFDLLRRVHDAVYVTGRCAWDAPAQFIAATAEPAGSRPAIHGAAAWWALAAMTGVNIDAETGTLFLSPRIPPGEDELRAPVFLPGFWADLRYSRKGKAHLRVLRNFGESTPVIHRVVPSDARFIGLQVRGGFIRQLKRPFEAILGARLRVKLLPPPERPYVLANPDEVPVPLVAAPGPLVSVDARTGEAVSLGAPVRIENVKPEPLPRFDLINMRTEATPVMLRVEGLSQPRYACYVRGRRVRTVSMRQLAGGVQIRLPGHYATPEHIDASKALRAISEAATAALADVRRMRPEPEKLLIVKSALDGYSKAAGAYGDVVNGSVRSEIVLEPAGAPPLTRPIAPPPTAGSLKDHREMAIERLLESRAAVREQFAGAPGRNSFLAALLPVRWDVMVKPGGVIEITATGTEFTPEMDATAVIEPATGWTTDRKHRPMGRIAPDRTARAIFKLTAPDNPLPNTTAEIELRLESKDFEYRVRRTVKISGP